MKNERDDGEKPNILLIMADDMGYCDPGCYGGEIRTSHIDGLADRGIRFTHFYNNAVCMATRASLLTGLYPQQVGERYAGRLQSAGNVTLAEVLKSAGYRTLMVGKWHNGNAAGELPVDRGFDRYWGLLSGCSNYFNPGEKRPGEPAPAHKFPGNLRPWGDDDKVIHPYNPEEDDFYTTDAFTRKALEFLDLYGPEDRPFFLYLAHCAPHFPMQARPEDIDRYEGGISNPLIVSWPRVINPCGEGQPDGGEFQDGRICREMGHVMDLMPTIAEIAGTEYPTTYAGHPVLTCEGKSLLPLFGSRVGDGAEREQHEALYWELGGCRAVRKGKWKLVSQGPPRQHMGMTIEPGEDAWELYDMEADRCELDDLSGKVPVVVKELEQLWKTWEKRCDKDRAGA